MRETRHRSPFRTFLWAALAVTAVWGFSRSVGYAEASAERSAELAVAPWNPEEAAAWEKPGETALRAALTELQYRVTQEAGTERPFQNEYWDNREHGIYVDIVSGEPLFSSLDKYKSGTGWPSFVRALVPDNILEGTDYDLGYARTELRSALAHSHLGHRFDDGPPPTGDRYCINSAALRFVPVREMKAAGYGDFLAPFREAGIPVAAAASAQSAAPAAAATSASASGQDPARATAYLAGGCYWGMEDLIRDLPGVLDTEVGFMGGTLKNPSYQDVVRKSTGHAESIRVLYDPAKLGYRALLDWFFTIHDPTTLNRQGNDRGTQYRSAIFVTDAEQRRVAEQAIAEWNASGQWKKPIVTQVEDAGPFTPAHEGHQDYLEKYPGGYTCHFVREWDN